VPRCQVARKETTYKRSQHGNAKHFVACFMDLCRGSYVTTTSKVTKFTKSEKQAALFTSSRLTLKYKQLAAVATVAMR
jgi:hypothetical protein